jgi:hypothetical protein
MPFRYLTRALTAAGTATFATTVAAVLLSIKDTEHPAAALNATSHILWGDEAASHDELDLRHTLLGGVLNAGAVGLWAALQSLLPKPRSAWGIARNAALISALAYATDYFVVPKRLTPGFEKRLTQGSLLTMYAVLAASLATASVLDPRD